MISIENFCPNIDFQEDFGIDLEKDEIIDSLGDLSDFVVDQSTTVRNELIAMEDALETADSVLNVIARFKGSGLYIVLPIAVITTILLAGTLLACGGFTGRTWECLQTVLLMRLLLIVSVVFWVFGSMFLLFGFVNADYCSGGLTPKNPDSTAFEIMDRFNLQESEPELHSILEHYILGCNTDSPFDFLNDYKGELVMAIMNMNVLLNSIEEATEEELELLCGNTITNEIAIVNDLSNILNELNRDVDQILEIIDCDRINSIYVDAVHKGICHNLPIATSWVCAFLITIGFCGMMLVTLRSSWLEAEYTYSEEEEEDLNVGSFLKGGSRSHSKSIESRDYQDGMPRDVDVNSTAVSALTSMDAMDQRVPMELLKPMESSRSWEDEDIDEEKYNDLVPVNIDELSAALKSV